MRSNEKKQAVSRAFAYILPLCVLSLLISAAIISVANDMYAFVKSDVEVTVDIPEGSSVSEISDMLADEGILNNPELFTFYVKRKGKSEALESFSGALKVCASMSYREILALF